jgi:polyhydroxybutyrate depolymerase
MVGDHERRSLLHVPPAYAHGATPLVINLHGVTVAPEEHVLFTGMNDTADEYGFLVATPEGLWRSWNGGSCCGDAAANDIDDVAFMRALVDELAEVVCLDRTRLYATGMSTGGFMAQRLACEASDVFAAVGSVAGALGINNCLPPKSVGVIALQGEDDQYVTLATGRSASQYWRYYWQCAFAPDTTVAFGDSQCETWSTCQAGVEVEWCEVAGMGHCWPGGPIGCPPAYGAASNDINANARMWEFFSRHTRNP